MCSHKSHVSLGTDVLFSCLFALSEPGICVRCVCDKMRNVSSRAGIMCFVVLLNMGPRAAVPEDGSTNTSEIPARRTYTVRILPFR